MTPRIIDPFELRADPALVSELRDHPGEHIERRLTDTTAIEVRADETSGGWKGGGLAIVYNSRSENLGGFTEIIKPGAARKVLKDKPDTRALQNHNPDLLLGRTTAGTLRLKDSPKGLDYEFDAPATSYADDLRVLMERGDITQSSFAFRVAPGGQEWSEDEESGALIRTVTEFSALYDVSPVTYPAYPASTSGVRVRDLTSLSGEELRALAWQIHRGDHQATAEERQVIDSLLTVKFSTVSPWTAERTLRAAAEEPELLAAIHNMRAHVELEPLAGDPEPDWRVAANQRRLRRLERELA